MAIKQGGYSKLPFVLSDTSFKVQVTTFLYMLEKVTKLKNIENMIIRKN